MDPKKTTERIQSQVSSYLSDFAGQSAPHQDVLSGPRRDSDVLLGAMGKIHSGDCTVHDLARAYKHSPHSPPAVLMKYVAHRVNHLDDYESSHKAHMLDHSFMASVRSGGASQHNSEVTPRHLNEWLQTNPGLVENAITHKAVLGSLVHKSGMNVRRINGEPYVAMTRGLNTPFMGEELTLSSFADMPDSGFGSTQHHLWMPVNDLWYSFPVSPAGTSGSFGHENEWVFAQNLPRFAARTQDVKPSYFSSASKPLDPALVEMGAMEDDTAAELIESGRLGKEHAETLHTLNLLGPKTLAATLRLHGHDPLFVNHFSVPREVALQQALQLSDEFDSDAQPNSHALVALGNPNLTAEDLNTVVTLPSFPLKAKRDAGSFRIRSVAAVASHPAFNESVANALVERILATEPGDENRPTALLPVIAKNAKVPCLSLHRALIEGLDLGEDCEWQPAKAVANCFNTSRGPGWPTGSTPQAFNNYKNSERYLRALSAYFGKNEGAEDPSNTYQLMLSGARLDDTTLSVLTDLARNGGSLVGTTPDNHQELMSEVARWNLHLTPRQLTVLATLPACAEGLMNRASPLPSSAQVEIAKGMNLYGVVTQLSSRDDLSPEAAEVILERTHKGDLNFNLGSYYWVVDIASNPRIPVSLIEKYVNHESSAGFANAVAHGLEKRPEKQMETLPAPPIGGLE